MKTIALLLLLTATAHADLMLFKFTGEVGEIVEPRRDTINPLLFEMEMTLDGSTVVGLAGQISNMNPDDIPGAEDYTTFGLDTVSNAWYCTTIPCGGAFAINLNWPETGDVEKTLSGSFAIDTDIGRVEWSHGKDAVLNDQWYSGRWTAGTSSLTAIPEPSSFVLVALGLGIGAIVRRQFRLQRSRIRS